MTQNFVPVMELKKQVKQFWDDWNKNRSSKEKLQEFSRIINETGVGFQHV